MKSLGETMRDRTRWGGIDGDEDCPCEAADDASRQEGCSATTTTEHWPWPCCHVQDIDRGDPSPGGGGDCLVRLGDEEELAHSSPNAGGFA